MWNKFLEKFSDYTIDPPGNYGKMILLPIEDGSINKSKWLIGKYGDLKKLATDLRLNKNNLRKFMGENKIRLGLRSTDVAPYGLDRQKRFGDFVAGKASGRDFTSERIYSSSLPVSDKSFSVNRRNDREGNVSTFWISQTPQSHHIVEFNHLKDINVSNRKGKEEMDHSELPCVLLAAEFHQSYISEILKEFHGLGEDELKRELFTIYYNLYVEKSPLFAPLWEVSKMILEHAFQKLKT